MRLSGGVHVAFTDRQGGGSVAPYASRNLGGLVGDDPATVRANRARTAVELGLDPGAVVYMRQVHSAEVAYVTEPFGDEPPPLDAVFTDRPGLALAALSADCATVLVADPTAGLVGAAHSGRVGTTSGVVPALVKAMVEYGGDPSRMVAVVGPMACGGCYEVPDTLRDEVAALLPEAHATTTWGTPSLDLRAAINAQLLAAEVADVRHDERCTIETENLFSHRRDRVTGRFAGLIWRELSV